MATGDGAGWMVHSVRYAKSDLVEAAMKEESGEAAFKVTLGGAERLEDLPIREVIEFLDGLVSLVARGSAELLHRPQPIGGRYEGPIEQASHIRLAGLGSGSVVASLLPARAETPTEGIGLDAETLSERAIGLIFDAAAGQAVQYPELSLAFAEFVQRTVARRPGATILFEDLRPGHEREVTVDVRGPHAVREGAPNLERDVTGRVFEANLEAHSAQVRTPSGERVEVQFDPDREEDIRRLLGNRAALRGEITYDARTKRAKAVHLREIFAGDQLGLDLEGVDFWTDRPLSELILEAGGHPVGDARELQLAGVSDAEWDALYAALGIAR
jgi:hypothetical protein